MTDRQFLIDAGKQSIEGSDEYLPTLIVTTATGTEVMVLAGGHPYDMLRTLVPVLRDMRPSALSFTVDSYMAKGDDQVLAMRERYGGSLAAAFAAGEPNVSEALIINIVTPTESEVVTLPYTRTDDGVVWRDEHTTGEFSGRMLDVLRAVWA